MKINVMRTPDDIRRDVPEGINEVIKIMDTIAKNSLGALQVANPPKKKGKKMYDEYNTGITMEEKRIQYLRDRAYEVFDQKIAKALEAFGMNSVEPPKSREEATQRLKEGRFEFEGADNPKAPNGYQWGYSNWMHFFRWTSETPRNEEGYHAYLDKLRQAYQNTIDEIMAGDYAKGLEAVKALENFEVTTVAAKAK